MFADPCRTPLCLDFCLGNFSAMSIWVLCIIQEQVQGTKDVFICKNLNQEMTSDPFFSVCGLKKSHLLNLYSAPLTPLALPPLRPSESLAAGLFLDMLDGGLTRCVGEAGPVGMSWCSLSSAVRWTHVHPVLIRFAAAAICPSSVINPGCYLAPPGRAAVVVFVRVCMGACV